MSKRGQATSAEVLGTQPHTNPPVVDIQTQVDLGNDTIDTSKIDQILTSSDVQNGGKVRLERRGPTDQHFQYVCKIPIEDFDIERIKLVYGGGDYKCQTFRANGQMYKPFTFSIDFRFKGSLDDQQIKALAADDGKANALADRQNVMLQQLMAARAENNGDNMMKMMMLMSQKSDQAMQLMMTQAAENQKSMVTLMTAVMAPRPTPAIDPMMIELIKLQVMNRPSGDPASSMSMLREMIGLAREFGGGPKEEKPEPSMLEKIFTAAAPVVERLVMPPRVSQPAPQPRSQSAPASLPEPSGGVDFKFMINMYLEQIIKAAERNSDPQSYADIIIENLPNDKLLDVQEILTREDWCATLFNNDARVRANSGWFEELRQLILRHGQQSDAAGEAESGDPSRVIKLPDGSSANSSVDGNVPGQVSV